MLLPIPPDLRLVLPHPGLLDDYIAARREGYTDTTNTATPMRDLATVLANPEGHLTALNEQGGSITLDDGSLVAKVPFAHFWLTDGSGFIGRVGVRYELSAWQRRYGGHIGYEIRPSLRRRGYGHAALALGKQHLRERGLSRLLLTCTDGNLGSARIIEAGGGVLEDITSHPVKPGARLRRYWIALG